MKCAECEKRTRKLKDDPRDPPLEETPCLCEDCYLFAAAEQIELLEIQISNLKDSLGRRY